MQRGINIIQCAICNNNINNNDEVVKTDYFGVISEPVCVYIECFTKKLLNGIEDYEPTHCDYCNKELVPEVNNIDIEEGIVWFNCPESGEEEEHSSIGEYLLQPEADFD